MLQRVFEHAGRLLPADRRYVAERYVRGWFEAMRLARADCVAVSFGKSGRTWLRVMMSRLFQLVYGLPEGELLEFANYHRRDARIPRVLFTHDNYLRDHTGDGTSKRVYRTKPVILLARHPADVTMSQYFQWKYRMRAHKVALNEYPATGSDLSPHAFMMGASGLTKVIGFLNEWAAALPELDRSLVLRYEDMRADTVAAFTRVGNFLGVDCDAAAIREAVDYAAFENMKQREADAASDSDRLRAKDVDNPDSFKTRRGKVGGWQDYFDDAGVAEIEHRVSTTLDPMFGYGPPLTRRS